MLKNDIHNILLGSKASPTYSNALYILFQILFAFSGLISLSYWGIRFHDYSLLVPKGVEGPPVLLSAYTHGINFVLLFLETLFF